MTYPEAAHLLLEKEFRDVKVVKSLLTGEILRIEVFADGLLMQDALRRISELLPDYIVRKGGSEVVWVEKGLESPENDPFHPDDDPFFEDEEDDWQDEGDCDGWDDDFF